MDRRIPLPSAPNTRDLGGLPVDGGIVRARQIYRSTMLANLSDEDLPIFESLGVTIIYDMRTEGERTSAPDRLPAGIEVTGLDVLADHSTDAATSIGNLGTNPELLDDVLGSGQAEALMEQTYRDFITLRSAQTSYRDFFHGLAYPNRAGAALVHCTTGKDRTGWAAASLLLLLGADEQTVRDDYLQSNTDLLPALQPLFELAVAQGITADLLLPVLGVRESYLDAALNQVDSRFGSIEGYFTTGLGLDSGTLDALRSRLID